jgi:hypothetical protein
MSAAHAESLPAPADRPRLGAEQRSTLAMYEQALWRKAPTQAPRDQNQEKETEGKSGLVLLARS